MGLLDDFAGFAKTPEGQGLLSAVAGGALGARRGTPWNNLGRAGIAGITGYSNAVDDQQTQALRNMQIAKLKQDQADAEALRNFDPSKFYQTPQQQALQANVGQPGFNPPDPSQFQPKFDQKGMIAAMMASNSPALRQQALTMLTKEDTPIALGDGGMLVTKDGRKLVENPKTPSLPSAIQEYQFAQQQGFKGTFQDFVLQQKRAGAGVTNILNDNLGLKPKDRFDMEDKLRTDYSKATEMDTKMLSAVGKLRSVLNGDATAMKDQAAIYQFAKTLDPDGAVRESDYAAVTNTAGLSDRVKNYLNKLQTGQMLSPTQRAEMLQVADAWEAMAKKKIGAQQKSYSGRAKMYNLQPENIFQVDSGGAKFLGFE